MPRYAISAEFDSRDDQQATYVTSRVQRLLDILTSNVDLQVKGVLKINVKRIRVTAEKELAKKQREAKSLAYKKPKRRKS